MNFKVIEAEQAVIGMCLSSPENIDRALDLGLSENFFSQDAHKELFAELVAARAKQAPSDIVGIGSKRPDLMSAMLKTIDNTPITQAVDYYANILKNCFFANKMLVSLNQLTSQLNQQKDFTDIRPFKDALEKQTYELLYGGEVQGFTSKTTSQVMIETIRRIEEKILDRKEGRNPFISTGIKALDKIIIGFKPGALYTVGARSGEGKTSSAITFAYNALKQGKNVVYLTVEMDECEIMQKFLALEGRIDSRKVDSGDFDNLQLDSLSRASGVLTDGERLTINYHASQTIERIELEVRRLKRSKKVDLLIIDYIQQVGLDHFVENSIARITEVTKRVKFLALDLQIPIIACAQLNREIAKDNKLPMAHHLRESGSIEQDSDVVVLIHREKTGHNIPSGVDNFIIDKNRHGPKGRALIQMNLQFSEIRDSEQG